MERIIRKHISGDIACNDEIIFSKDKSEIGKRLVEIYEDWEIINPKYYRYTDDNSVLEIWYNRKGMLLTGIIKGYISNSWTDELREEITYKKAMSILEKEENKDLGYNNKDLMSRIITNNVTERDDLEDMIKKSKGNSCYEIAIDYAKDDMVDAMSYNFIMAKSGAKQNNNGGASDWYALPKKANTLQDLIEYRNMNGSVKDIFKACYRLGIKTEDELRDLNKMAYYSLREVGRITGRKDYITIAKELMGSQAIEEE